MDHRTIALLPALGLWFCLGARSVIADWSCAGHEAACKTVFVVHNSWHAAIVLKRHDLTNTALPELADFPDVRNIEISWGDRDFFTDPDAGFWAALRAAFWSKGSVLHLVGFNDSVAQFYQSAEISELRVAPAAFRLLVDFISQTFARPTPTDPAPPSPGLFPYSRFYPATARFSVSRTCNTWVAEALAASGVPISPGEVLTAGSLASQIASLDKRH